LSAGVIRRLVGTSSRCQQFRSRAATVAMTRPTGDRRFTCGTASGSPGGQGCLTMRDSVRKGWPVTVRIAATRSGGSIAPPLLRNDELILHPLQAWRLRIGFVVNASHDDCQSLPASVVDTFGDCLFRIVPEISHHQRWPEGSAGYEEPIRAGRDSDGNRRKEDRNRPGNEQQCLDSLGVHETSVATRNRARCSELHGVRRRAMLDVLELLRTESSLVRHANLVASRSGVRDLFLPLLQFPTRRLDRIQPARFPYRVPRACARRL